MRNVTQISIMRVAASDMRATVAARPEYGVSSSLRNPQNQCEGPVPSGTLGASVAISTPSNNDDCRLAYSKQVGRRVFHADPHWISGSQVHPVQRSLHIGQALLQTANYVCIRRHPEADTVHHAREAHIRLGHNIDVRL